MWARGKEEWGIIIEWVQSLFGMMEKFWSYTVVMVYNSVDGLNATKCTL